MFFKNVKSISPLNCTSILGFSLSLMTLKGQYFLSSLTTGSSKRRPIRRLASKMVFMGLEATWFLAPSPTSRSLLVKATKLGVVRLPWSFAMISTLPLKKTPTHEYVVPRSIPMALLHAALLILFCFLRSGCRGGLFANQCDLFGGRKAKLEPFLFAIQ